MAAVHSAPPFMNSRPPIQRLINDHMVLQCDMPLILRGWAAPGSPVSANIATHKANAKANDAGTWELTLAPLPAGGPHELSITVDGDEQVFTDILIGEVWLCGGQSNMVFPLSGASDAEAEIAAADLPRLRVATVRGRAGITPCDDVELTWKVCSPATAGAFSAVGYFFARHLIDTLDVSVGLIVAASGHTPAEAWMSRSALESDSAFAPLLAEFDNLIAQSPGALDDLEPWRQQWLSLSKAHNKLFTPWYNASLEAHAAGKPYPPMPTPPRGVANPQNPTALYNTMIAPLERFRIRGAIFYQGETNAIFGTSHLYRKLFPALIQSWRDAWQQGDFPFLFTQIANHDDIQCTNADELWPQLRQSQVESLATPNTAMAVTIDVGESHAIHPPNKRTVGLRLALAAQANVYNQPDIHWSGPLYRDHHIDGDTIRITFDHAETGLDLRGIAGFQITGDGKHWHTANPTIKAHDLYLTASAVPSPLAARYAWKADPKAVLFNKAGFPASPFTTRVNS